MVVIRMRKAFFAAEGFPSAAGPLLPCEAR
jgi:hypothetical protein